jgi:hypothetical protein
MFRTRTMLAVLSRHAIARSALAAPLQPRPVSIPRSFSIFASSEPPSGESYKKIMSELGNATTGEEVLDSQMPLGAPKPSALNRIRTTGRASLESLEKRRDEAQDKLARAMEYKAKREAQKKATQEAEAAKKS